MLASAAATLREGEPPVPEDAKAVFYATVESEVRYNRETSMKKMLMISSCYQRSNTMPQQLPSNVQSWDVSSSTVSPDRLDAPLPHIEQPTHRPASLTPGLSPSRPHVSTPFTLSVRFSDEGMSARLSPAIIMRHPQYPICPFLQNFPHQLRQMILVVCVCGHCKVCRPYSWRDQKTWSLLNMIIRCWTNWTKKRTVSLDKEDAEEETAEMEDPESASDDDECVSPLPSSISRQSS